MNTARPSSQNRIAAFTLSTVLTLAMLLGVNQLAVSEAPASLLAQVQGSRA